MAKRTAPNGAGSIRKRSDGRWEGRYTAGYDGGTGKPIRRTVYGRTQKEVRQKLTDVSRALDTGTYQEPSSLTVAEWLEEWLTVFCVNKVKPLTMTSYRQEPHQSQDWSRAAPGRAGDAGTKAIQ